MSTLKLILWHAKFLDYKDKRASTRPKGISKVRNTRSKGNYSNALAVFTCVEMNDTDKEVLKAVESIRKTIDLIQSTRKVVIVPFVHLSESIALPKDAKKILRALDSELRSSNLEVDTISFGYHKEFELHFRGYGHPLAIAFRSFSRRITQNK